MKPHELIWLLALVFLLGGCSAGTPAPQAPSLATARQLAADAAQLGQAGGAVCSAAPDPATCTAAAADLAALGAELGRALDVAEGCAVAQDLACALAAGAELARLVPRVEQAVRDVR